MAEIIAQSMDQAQLPTECKSVEDVKAGDLLEYDAIVLGSPTYYGHMAAQIKQLIDETVTSHGKLDGKIGAAFSSAALALTIDVLVHRKKQRQSTSP